MTEEEYYDEMARQEAEMEAGRITIESDHMDKEVEVLMSQSGGSER